MRIVILTIILFLGSSAAYSSDETQTKLAKIETCIKESDNKEDCINIIAKDCIENDENKAADCQQDEIKIWDQLLNRDYNKLLKISTPEKVKALKTAQRDWVRFRDSKCNFNRLQTGSMSSNYGESWIKYETARQAIWMNDGLSDIDINNEKQNVQK